MAIHIGHLLPDRLFIQQWDDLLGKFWTLTSGKYAEDWTVTMFSMGLFKISAIVSLGFV